MGSIPMEYWDIAAAMIHNYDVSDLPEDKQRYAVRLIEAGDEEGLATMLWSMDEECQKMFGENTMKLSKRQLKRIIKEEKQKLLQESSMEQSYQYAEQLINDAILELAENFSDGELGDGAYDAKMNGDLALHELLTQAAMAAREK